MLAHSTSYRMVLAIITNKAVRVSVVVIARFTQEKRVMRPKGNVRGVSVVFSHWGE